MIEVFARIPGQGLQAQASRFVSLDAVLRDKDTSTWTITGPRDDFMTQLTKDRREILVLRNGRNILSGPWLEWEFVADENGEMISISGAGEEICLEETVVKPSQAEETPNGKTRYGGSKYRVWPRPDDPATTDVESAMYYYADSGLNNPDDAVIGLLGYRMAENQRRGPAVTEKARMDKLLEILVDLNGQSAALSSQSFGWRVVDKLFTVTPNVDRTKTAVFSRESGNLENFSLRYTAPSATHVILGANGEGTDKTYWRLGSDEQARITGRRIEVFIDGSEDNTKDLANAAAKEYNDRVGYPSIAMQPVDMPFRTFGEDYDLGDIVMAEGYTGILDEVRLAYNADGELITPNMGARAYDRSLIDDALFRRLTSRVSELEKRT